MRTCKFCEKELPKRSAHATYCNKNPHRKYRKNPMQGRKGCNQYAAAAKRGVKLIMPESVRRKISEKSSKKVVSARQRELLSIAAKKNKLGGVTQSRWIKYNGKTLGSSYELILAKDLDANGVKWDTCKRFSYIDPNGKARTYTPDLYLPDYDVYLDPKNDFLINSVNPGLGFSDLEKIRRVEEQNNIRVIVLSKEQLSWEFVSKLLDRI